MTARSRNAFAVMAGVAFGRLSLFVVLAVAASHLGRSAFDVLVYALAVATAVQILIDPNTSNLLILRWKGGANRREDWSASIRLQLLVAGIGVALTPAIIGLTVRTTEGVLVGIAVAGMMGGESVARLARCVWQADERFGRYAAVDVTVGLGRLLLAVPLLLANGLGGVAVVAGGIGVAWLVAVGAMAVRERLTAGASFSAVRQLAKDVWPYAASTSLSALYAQAPTVLIGVTGQLRAAAVYGVSARITQATELVPSAIAASSFPRLARVQGRERRGLFREQVRLALIAGVAISAATVGVGAVLLPRFSVSLNEGFGVVSILAVALIPKFVSYQLVVLAMAKGRIRARLIASGIVAVGSVTAVLLVAPAGAVAVAVVGLISESMLLLILIRVSASPEARAVPLPA
jgi:O-antigen/teichoic acid export membrane protein